VVLHKMLVSLTEMDGNVIIVDIMEMEESLFLILDHLDPTTRILDEDGGDYDPEYDENKVTCYMYCNLLKSNYQPNGKNKEEKLKDEITYIQPKRERALELYIQIKQAN
jgi:hypothetical protein